MSQKDADPNTLGIHLANKQPMDVDYAQILLSPSSQWMRDDDDTHLTMGTTRQIGRMPIKADKGFVLVAVRQVAATRFSSSIHR